MYENSNLLVQLFYFPCSEGGVQVFGRLWWQFVIEKMVDFWCFLLVLMIGLSVVARVAR